MRRRCYVGCWAYIIGLCSYKVTKQRAKFSNKKRTCLFVSNNSIFVPFCKSGSGQDAGLTRLCMFESHGNVSAEHSGLQGDY